MNKAITILDAAEGKSFSVVGDTYRILVDAEQTDGTYAVIDMLVPPGGGPGPHAHAAITEMFYVVSGSVEFKMESGTFTATAGSFVNIPLGGAVHAFKNTSGEVAHLICTVIPAGLDHLFREIGKPVEPGKFLPQSAPEPEEIERLKSLAVKYGQELYPPDFFDKK